MKSAFRVILPGDTFDRLEGLEPSSNDWRITNRHARVSQYVGKPMSAQEVVFILILQRFSDELGQFGADHEMNPRVTMEGRVQALLGQWTDISEEVKVLVDEPVLQQTVLDCLVETRAEILFPIISHFFGVMDSLTTPMR